MLATLTLPRPRSRRLAEWLRRLAWVQKVPGSIPGSNLLMQLSQPFERWRGGHGNRVGTKITIEAQKVIAENTISVEHCVIPLRKGL